MFTPHGKGWTGLSAPALADQQIGSTTVASPTYGKGRVVPRRITDLEKEVCSILSVVYVHVCPMLFIVLVSTQNSIQYCSSCKKSYFSISL
jgi:hypothetical protein